MHWETICKTPLINGLAPNLIDYDAFRAAFTWKDARNQLDGLPDGAGLNITHEAVDRHAAGSRRDHIALRWIGRDGRIEDFSYGQLQELTNRFANLLNGLGVGKGERVFSLLGRVPTLYITALGTLKHGSVYCPLFSAFGPEPIRARMSIGDARVLVTTEALYRRKVAPLRDSLPELKYVLLVDGNADDADDEAVHSFDALLQTADDGFTVPPTNPEDWDKIEPVYQSFPGWSESSRGVTEFDKLPANAQAYLEQVEQLCGAPIHMVSTGPDRSENIILQHPLG